MKQFNGKFFRDFWKIAGPYWRTSEERWKARGLLLAVALLNLLMVAISYQITEWYNTFWDALQAYNAPQAWHEILIFLLLVVPYIIAAVYQTYLTQMLQIYWRRWLTQRYVKEWLAEETFYHMQLLGGTDNPDQRISQDLATFTSQTLNLLIGLLSSVTTIAAFIVMLWNLSSQVVLPWNGVNHVLPGYLVWTALLYSVVGTILIAWVGRKLIPLNFQQERYNADFRYSLVRLRENSESVALYGGEAQEIQSFHEFFSHILRNFKLIMKRTRRLNWWISGYGQAAILFPILVSLPAYFVKAIKLGAIMQISSAFGQVQSAFSFIVNSYPDLASWHAVVDRLRFFEQAMEEARQAKREQKIAHTWNSEATQREGQPRLEAQVTLRLPGGRDLLRNLNLNLPQGVRLLISGPSGCGKSTLLRALAGIWPFGEGEVHLPERKQVLFLPQKPYLPLGSLAMLLSYPQTLYPAEELEKVLKLVELENLLPLEEDPKPWSQILSPGEQQRVAFARVFLQRPSWIFLDEATSALDEARERRLYSLLLEIVPQASIISVGHRSSLAVFHQQRLSWDSASWHLEPC